VVTEVSVMGETPDAIGWYGRLAILIECKASKADFLADVKKFFRAYPAMGIGSHRYYLTPVGMLEASEVPAGWGLIEFDGRRYKIIRESAPFAESNRDQEVSILISTLRRVGNLKPRGVSIRHYVMQSKCTATVHTEEWSETDAVPVCASATP